MPPVCRIAEGTEVGVVRCGNVQSTAGAQKPVKLFHRADHVCNVFDDVYGTYVVEGSVAKRVRKVVEVAEHIRSSSGDAVDPDRARKFVYPAPDIEDTPFGSLLRIARHSSSVSMAKSA